jgi:hypothetical protein
VPTSRNSTWSRLRNPLSAGTLPRTRLISPNFQGPRSLTDSMHHQYVPGFLGWWSTGGRLPEMGQEGQMG